MMKLLVLLCGVGLGLGSPPSGSRPRSPVGPSGPAAESVEVLALVDAARQLVRRNKLATEKVLMKIFPLLVKLLDVDGDGRWTVSVDHSENYRRLERYWASALRRPVPASLQEWLAMDLKGDGIIDYGDLAAVIVDRPDSGLWTLAMSGLFSRAADFDGNGRVEKHELMRLIQRSAQQEAQGRNQLPSILQVMPAEKPLAQSPPLVLPSPVRPKSFFPAAPPRRKPFVLAAPPAPPKQMAPKSQPFTVLMKIQKLQRKIAGSPYKARAILRRGWPQIKPLLDMNNDGALGTFDLKGLWAKTNAYWQIYLQPSVGTAFPDQATWLRALDSDQDGRFSLEEFESAMVHEVNGALWMPFAAVPFMARFDTAPQDGLIQPQEIPIIQTTPFRHIFEQL